MKIKKVKIIIESPKDTDKRWANALKGKAKNDTDVIVCSSLKIAEKIFSEPRLAILRTVATKEVKSVNQLATFLKRDFKNVYNDVMFLVDLGLLGLEESGRGKSSRPVMKYGDINLSLAA